LRGELRGLLEAIVHTLMNPDYLAVVRVVIAETTRRPELGELFRASIASRILTAASEVVSRVTQLCTGVTVDAGAQLVVGSVLPHVLLEGLLRPDDVRRPDEAQLDRLAGVLASAICAR
jgi:hypothetical protein